MRNIKNSQLLRLLPKIIFTFVVMLSIGSYILLFLVTYMTFEPALFVERIATYQHGLPYLWLFGFLFTVFYVLPNWNRFLSATGRKSLDWQIVLKFLIFLVVLGIGVLIYSLDFHFRLIDLITFVVALYAILSIAQNYSLSSGYPGWQHPTTAGTIVEGTIALGCITGLAIYQNPDLRNTLGWIIFVVLLFEGLTIWSRFRFLSRTNQVTRQAATLMLESHITLFGIRFVFGVAMPIVYLFWILLIKKLPLNSVIVMVAVGEFCERMLFFITQDTATEEPVKKPYNEIS